MSQFKLKSYFNVDRVFNFSLAQENTGVWQSISSTKISIFDIKDNKVSQNVLYIVYVDLM